MIEWLHLSIKNVLIRKIIEVDSLGIFACQAADSNNNVLVAASHEDHNTKNTHNCI